MEKVNRKPIVLKQTTYAEFIKYGKYNQSADDIMNTILTKLKEQTESMKKQSLQRRGK